MERTLDCNQKCGFICDMDGVIYHGNHILPGAAEFIQWLHDEGKESLNNRIVKMLIIFGLLSEKS